MTFRRAADLFLEDMRSTGRINSDRSADTYAACLERFAGEIGNRDPRTVGREDVKRFLRGFAHPNTQRRQRSMLMSFFKWMLWEGMRKDNPAEQTRPPKARKPTVYRMTLDETLAFLNAARGPREQRVAFLGVCAGLRREELRLLQGRHFRREGWLWVSSDIAKGGRERWIPVMADLLPIAADCNNNLADDEYVLPARQNSDPGVNAQFIAYPKKPGDGKVIWRMTQRIGKRAGIPSPVNPHMMRHAFADHIARLAGVRSAQMMLGHASISTTEGYLSIPTLDELASSVGGVSFGLLATPQDQGAQAQEWRRWESNPRYDPTGIPSGFFDALDPQIALYAERFAGVR